MITNPLLAVGLLLILGYWGGRAANALKLPRVSGYLVAGMLLSPSLAHIFSRPLVERDFTIITEIALGIIAYSIGGSLVLERLRRLGKSISWITISQALGAFMITTGLLLPTIPFLTGLAGSEHQMLTAYLPLALVIGAISVATAPGAVLAIISELKASGPLTSILLGVIALDDGLAIIFFALAATAAHTLINPEAVSWLATLTGPVIEIGLSLLLGLLAGLGLMLMGHLVRRREALLMVILGILFLTSGVAAWLKFSPLLANMVAGFIVVNLAPRHHDFFLVVEQIEEPLFGLFFGVAGAHMDLVMLKSVGWLSVTILVFRMVGKQLGTWVGAKISQAPPIVEKYLGLGLFPQAGVTIGLVLIAQDIFPHSVLASILVNAVIGAVILNELIAPPLVKYALLKAGETAPE
jgi:Kef-type K+ transport system membrane component KefB